MKSAADDLANIWLASDQRYAVTAATSQLDRELSIDAETKGEQLREGLRALNVPPLRVIFSVSELDRVVQVAVVRAI